MRARVVTFVLLSTLIGGSGLVGQQEGAADVLVVGTKEAPPFAMREHDGSWTGISIELWKEIARQLDLEYRFEDQGDVPSLLRAVAQEEVDAAIAAITITGEREQEMDFSHPFYTTGFAIAVAPLERPGLEAFFQRFVSWRFIRSLGLLVIVLLVVGLLMWLVERRANPEQFGGRSGIWSGFWWAAVTMTTVGYGDKAPRSIPGRILGLIWMFTAIVLIGGLIAGMTSALTVSRLEAPIRGPEDLPTARVATLPGSSTEAYLRENRIPFRPHETLDGALREVVAGRLDAVVYDAPLLQYQVTQRFSDDLEVLPRTFGRQDYCVALPTGSALREPINRVLLGDKMRDVWADILFRYLEEIPAPPPKPKT